MSIFGSKPAAPAPPPPPPTPDNSAAELAARQEAERKARGRASTILTGGQGLLDGPQNAKKVLLNN